MKDDRRSYIKLAIHTPNDDQKLYREIVRWCDAVGCSLTECLIQSSSASLIGWIVYSSYFTEINLWKSTFQTKTSYEWGFKMVPITDSDRGVAWNKRKKALGVFVPDEKVEEATLYIAEFLEKEKPEDDELDGYFDRFLFVKPESEMQHPDDKESYKYMVSRHASHTLGLQPKLFNALS